MRPTVHRLWLITTPLCYKFNSCVLLNYLRIGLIMKKAQGKSSNASSNLNSRDISRENSQTNLSQGKDDLGVVERQNKLVSDMGKLKNSCKTICQNCCYIALGILTIVMSLAVIVVAILSSVANKIYDADQSSHLVAMVLLAVTAAVTLSAVIYSIVGVSKEHTKPLYATAFVLVILAILQALIAGIAVHVTDKDELKIGQALASSFNLARESNMRHLKLWASTQNELECCGIYGPEDYRDPDIPLYFPPNIPISCCPSYKSSRPDSTQEREKELCRAQRQYWMSGCKLPVVEVFKESAVAVIIVSVILIVLEVLTAVVAGVLSKRSKNNSSEKSDTTAETTVDA